MKVTPVPPVTFPMNYKRPKFFVRVDHQKTTIINGETGERKEFTDSLEAFRYKETLERE